MKTLKLVPPYPGRALLRAVKEYRDLAEAGFHREVHREDLQRQAP
jgi:hypothetical protein